MFTPSHVHKFRNEPEQRIQFGGGSAFGVKFLWCPARRGCLGIGAAVTKMNGASGQSKCLKEHPSGFFCLSARGWVNPVQHHKGRGTSGQSKQIIDRAEGFDLYDIRAGGYENQVSHTRCTQRAVIVAACGINESIINAAVFCCVERLPQAAGLCRHHGRVFFFAAVLPVCGGCLGVKVYNGNGMAFAGSSYGKSENSRCFAAAALLSNNKRYCEHVQPFTGSAVKVCDQVRLMQAINSNLSGNVSVASVQWTSGEVGRRVGDAALARDILSSQGIAGGISDALYAAAIRSYDDETLPSARQA